MPDYGHPLRFGAFITPTVGATTGPAQLAVRAEELGLDLVTFQDHPYQAGFYDTWTLLAFVAARTEKIELSGNVLNLPLRPPAVLARSAASLDLLSGGRLAMGLGTGAFWDAIEAMGGQRRTPGEAVTALTEAIDIMRQLWDPATRGGVKVDGEFYRVHGAKRGPAPAHTIPIWLGAYGPRMLRTTARLADGWLPSMSYLKPGDLARGNDTIDIAAEKAGREPREIVRMLNIGPDMTPADIARHALADGISTFIVAADDERTLTYLAREIAPAARELVAEGRASAGTTTAAPTRSASARARRVAGIDYDGVPASLAPAIEPGDPAYARYTASYMRGGAPGIVLKARTSAQVSDAIGFAAHHPGAALGILSAGHGISGRSLNRGGVVIDVSAINHVTVTDAEAGTVHIGPGARWVDVARVLAPHNLAITSGDYGGVGVGGLATAGGVGLFAREQGLTIDLLKSVEIVTADGAIRRASEAENPDLFWAVRGAGANFGVVTDFEFTAPEVGEIGFAQLVFDASDIAGFLERWGAAMEAAPRSVSGEIILGAPRAGVPNYARAMLLVDEADPDAVVDALQPIATVAPLVDQQVAMATYEQVLTAFFRDAPQAGQGEPHSRSGLADHLTPTLARRAAELLESGASYFFQIRMVGGAVNDVEPDATAYAWRDANFAISAMGSARTGLDEQWSRLLPHLHGMYLSFETSTGPEVLARAFPAEHLDRLRVLKRRYDPVGLFRDNFYIDPAEAAPDRG